MTKIISTSIGVTQGLRNTFRKNFSINPKLVTNSDVKQRFLFSIETYTNSTNTQNKKQLERLLALNQLMNIAYYYNDKQYMRAGYYIGYDKLEDRYFVNNLDNVFTQKAGMAAMFIYAKDAQAVIDNPNFRSILDTLCK